MRQCTRESSVSLRVLAGTDWSDHPQSRAKEPTKDAEGSKHQQQRSQCHSQAVGVGSKKGVGSGAVRVVPHQGGCRHQGSRPWLEFWHGARRKRMETMLPTLPSAASHLYPAPATGQSQPETRGQRSLGMESLGHRVSLLPCFVSKMQPQSVLRFIQTWGILV